MSANIYSRPAVGRKYDDKEDSRMLEMHAKGMSNHAIAEQLGRSEPAVVARLARLKKRMAIAQKSPA